MPLMRLDKLLSECTVLSRSQLRQIIKDGSVSVDGAAVTSPEHKVDSDTARVELNGKQVSYERFCYYMLNKPAGIVCTAEKREKNNVIDYLNYPKRIYPIGRLDKDSEGLLLLTNNGEIVNKMMRSGNRHEKEYIVTVNKTISDSFIRGLAGGVPLVELGVTTRKCHVKKLSSKQFKIILTQGYNRQIRRMCEYFGYRVVKLERVRIMNIELGDLPRGKYRTVTPLEYKGLKRLIADSSNQPVMPDTNKNHSDKKYTDKKHTDKKYPDRRAK